MPLPLRRDEVVARAELVLLAGQAEAPAPVEQQQLLPPGWRCQLETAPAKKCTRAMSGRSAASAGASISSSTRPVNRPP